ncbi:hypothetical protein CCAX7_14740 [Capsulimonas corticalis]|uniref:Uncharacterized protein n=1 Tax=Capsulimonas corticalis TaxID=2219043 RepID=A0A402CZH7_9BACT|nr:nucleoside 2-deoxyribosyltransferase [Capsulimonas corticalis]BDI29423.1 hypothetical protein CCAX7_14740 [Capsulimonas corticalis]
MSEAKKLSIDELLDKPQTLREAMKDWLVYPSAENVFVYFAGKVRWPGDDYRCKLFHKDVMEANNDGRMVLDLAGTRVFYAGPTCIDGTHDDQSIYGDSYFQRESAPATHGCGIKGRNGVYIEEGVVVHRCLEQIKKADFVFAYIDDLSCYGTLAEIGYASAIGKPIVIIVSFEVDDQAETKTEAYSSHGAGRSDLWFVLNLPGVNKYYNTCVGNASDFFQIIRNRSWKAATGGANV